MIRVTSRRVVTVAIALVGVMLLSGCELATFMPGTPRFYWCDPTDTAVNDGHTTAFSNFYTTPKGPLSQGDCFTVSDEIKAAANFAAQYPNVAAAQAAGWRLQTVFTPGQGAHFVDPNRLTGPFDPTRPNYLMYNGTGATANLVGMMFLVDTQSPTTPPAGFPGANDHWHNHGLLCVKNGVVIGEMGHMPGGDGQCAAQGGAWVDVSSQWMVHVWLPIYAGWRATDIFNVDHPSLL